MNTQTTTTRFLARAAMTLVASLMTSIAPASQPEPGQPVPGENVRPSDPAAAKARLQRRLEESEKTATRLREALARIEKGESPADVMRELDLGPRPGMNRPDGPPEGRLPEGRPDGRPEGRREGRPQDFRPEGRQERFPGDRENELAGDGARPDERREAMEFLKEQLPNFAAKIEKLGETDRVAADRLMNRMMPRIREAMNIKKRDPEMFALKVVDMKSGILVIDRMREFREAMNAPESTDKPAKVEEATSSLRAALESQFDARLAHQEHEARVLVERTAEINADIARKRTDRSKMIDMMMTRIRDNRDAPMDDRPPRRMGEPRRPNTERPEPDR